MTQKPIRTFGVENADSYWKDRESKGRISEKRVHHFIRDLVVGHTPPSGNVLICGVGDGHEYRLCSEQFPTWGIEMSQYAIDQYEFSTERIKRADLNDGIPDFPEKFDAITVSMVLHWLDDPEQFLARSRNHLSDHGALIIIIPNITHYRHRIKFLFGVFPPISQSHRNFQTPTEVEHLFQRAGYRIIQRAPSKNALKTKMWPKVFATDIGYVIKPT